MKPKCQSKTQFDWRPSIVIRVARSLAQWVPKPVWLLDATFARFALPQIKFIFSQLSRGTQWEPQLWEQTDLGPELEAHDTLRCFPIQPFDFRLILLLFCYHFTLAASFNCMILFSSFSWRFSCCPNVTRSGFEFPLALRVLKLVTWTRLTGKMINFDHQLWCHFPLQVSLTSAVQEVPGSGAFPVLSNSLDCLRGKSWAWSARIGSARIGSDLIWSTVEEKLRS